MKKLITYEIAKKAKESCKHLLIKDPNIQSIGVVAITDESGMPTGEYAVEVGVESLEIYSAQLSHGDLHIPQEIVLKIKDEVANDISEQHVKLNVVQTGQIKTLFSGTNTTDLADATDKLSSTPANVLGTTIRKRPSLCGFSVGHPHITAGTIGLLVSYEGGPNANNAYILSNNHVLCANNAAFIHDEIIQPASSDNGIVGKDTIGRLWRFVPLMTNAFNFVDAAIAEVQGKSKWRQFASPQIYKIGYPNDLQRASIGMEVIKSGRSTEFTTGVVLSDDFTIRVNYNNLGVLFFDNQIKTTKMSEGGDSGSCLVEKHTNKPVGLLFAGTEKETFHNHLDYVLNLLTDRHENKYPNGKVHVFEKEHFPLRVIKRPYSTFTFKRSTPEITFFTSSLPRGIPGKCSRSFGVVTTLAAAISVFKK